MMIGVCGQCKKIAYIKILYQENVSSATQDFTLMEDCARNATQAIANIVQQE